MENEMLSDFIAALAAFFLCAGLIAAALLSVVVK
jgi:hypothetical protein